MNEQLTTYDTEHIREALVQDPRVNELGVHVRMVNGALLVTGDVPTEERRQAIGDVVAELAPGMEVRNDVSVTDLSAPVDQEVVS